MENTLEINNFITWYNHKGLAKNPKSPTFTGQINVDGRIMKISMWQRKSKSGMDMITGNIQVDNSGQYQGKDSEPPHTPIAPIKQVPSFVMNDGDDDLPF